MITPIQAENLVSSIINRPASLDEIIQQIDDKIKRVHGWHPWEEAILDYELTVPIRNKVAQLYVEAGWNYVYHHTSSENHESPGLTVFRFSTKPLGSNIMRNCYELNLESSEIRFIDENGVALLVTE